MAPFGASRAGLMSVAGIDIPDSVVDNFESARSDPAGPYESGETIADYYRGDTASFERSQTGVIEDSWSLRWTGTAGDEIWSIPGDGLPNYPAATETTKHLLKEQNVWRPWVVRASESGISDLLGYGARISAEDDEFILWRLDSGGLTELDSSTAGVTQDTLYWIEISPPESGGSVTVERYNVDESTLERGSLIDSLSSNDDNHTDCTGHGFRSSSADSDATMADAVTIV